MEIGRSLSFPFREPSWLRRTAIGALLELFPLLVVLPALLGTLRHSLRHGFPLTTVILAAVAGLGSRWITLGYFRRIALGVFRGDAAGLPAWDRLDEDLVEGIKLWLLSLGLFLPAAGLTAAMAFLFVALGAPWAAWLPVLLVLPVAALATLFVLPAALLASVAEGELSAAFDVTRLSRRIGAAAGAYLLAFLVAVAAEIVAQVGLLVVCVGIFATRFLAHCVAVHAFASAYREGCPAAPAPPAGAPAAPLPVLPPPGAPQAGVLRGPDTAE